MKCAEILPVSQERDDQIRELSEALREKEGGSTAAIFPSLLECDGLRRSQRIASSHKRSNPHEHVELEHTKAELAEVKAELEQCKAELDLKQTELTLKTLGKSKYQTLKTSDLIHCVLICFSFNKSAS